MAGVEVGSVQAVRARPEMKEAPAEVVMVLTPSYDLNLPNDSTASVSTEGVLGQTYVAIDASHASGSPIGTNGVLHTNPTTELSTPELLQKFGEIMSKRCDCDSSNGTTAGKKISKNSPE
jgi:ABC-type transporter Mla subunit MlaD